MLDENVRFIGDPDHSADEERFLPLGFSFQSRRLMICHCCRDADSVMPDHHSLGRYGGRLLQANGGGAWDARSEPDRFVSARLR
jgi:hypothetical protein